MAASSMNGQAGAPASSFSTSRMSPGTPTHWVKAKRDELEGKGLKHVFAQEFLRDGTAGLEGQLIPGEWVEAAVDACTKLGITPTGEKVAALDVADGGK